jgi:hypothetical protein
MSEPEKFSIIVIEETQHWADGILEEKGIEGAFAYYLIRHGERTHICSFTPSSWCYFIRNDFVYDSDNEAAHEWAGDEGRTEGGQSDYFGFMNPESMDPRFIAETFTLDPAEHDFPDFEKDPDGNHKAIWEAAEQPAHEFDCNGLWADINNLWTYRVYQREQLEKRRAMNEPVMAQGYRAEFLPLFYAAADRMGVKTYEAAREIGWL